MLDLGSLFVSAAHAADGAVQTAADAAPQAATIVGSGDDWARFLPLFLIFIVFYVLLIRPQQKRLDEQANMIKALKKGDKVVTSGGLVGKITKEDGEKFLEVEIAKGVNVKVMRSTISSLADNEKKNEK